jgi:signal transduction histidine kinase
MARLLQALTLSFNLPALLCWTAIALLLPREGAMPAWIAMAAFALAYMCSNFAQDVRALAVWLLAEALAALALVALAPGNGAAPALLVVLAAQLALRYALTVAIPALLAVNLALVLLAMRAPIEKTLFIITIYVSFQAFAVLVARLARDAEAARDRLTFVNADLLATRALLADSVRDAERLQVARDLHDVAGHKLTALILNLRALAADPALRDRGEIATAHGLAQGLLADIRGVVRSLREQGGLDLATALRALAAPLPKPRLLLEIGEDVHIGDAGLAEAVLRIVQEALTNSARHAGAGTLQVRLMTQAGNLQLAIEDDGRLRGPLRIGNGLAGIRERVEARGGTLTLGAGPSGALRIEVNLPA